MRRNTRALKYEYTVECKERMYFWIGRIEKKIFVLQIVVKVGNKKETQNSLSVSDADEAQI